MPPHAKLLQPVVNQLNGFFLNLYNQVWVPDTKGADNLSGSLSHNYIMPGNVRYIGHLSRFQYWEAEKHYDLLVILSGPEPQRSTLETIILQQLVGLPLKSLIVQGKTETNERKKLSPNIEIISHLDSKKLNEAILSSKLIISRSGYSNVMDLVCLNKKAVFIPTPGQTEQEYLADYLQSKGRFHFQLQENFDLRKAVEEGNKLNGKENIQSHNDQFKQALLELLETS